MVAGKALSTSATALATSNFSSRTCGRLSDRNERRVMPVLPKLLASGPRVRPPDQR
jgi:hypothetical protein